VKATVQTATDVEMYVGTFQRSPEAAQSARRLIQFALESWSLPEACDDAVLVISELVANAVRHAKAEPIRVSVTRIDSGRVCLVVSDRSRAMPYLRPPRLDDVRGRGLHLVDALCDRWGTDLYAWGKRVWVELQVRSVP